MKALRVLRSGKQIRFARDGQLYEVVRVSPGAAYVRKLFDPPRVVRVVGRDGIEREIHVRHGMVEPGISRCSFVIREEN